jgi:GNAT superfamily N-acetyltransferase
MPIVIVRHEDHVRFGGRARPFLMREECANCFILGLLAPPDPRAAAPTPLPSPGTLWMTLESDGEVIGAATQTRPIALAVTRLPTDALDPLARTLADLDWPGRGFVGPVEAVDPLASLWAERSGWPMRQRVSLRLFALTDVVPPPPVAGRMIEAPLDQLDLIARWHDEFMLSIGEPVDDPRGRARQMLDERRLFAWEDAGQLRCLAASAGATPNGIRINHVYTPPDFRGRGYASNLVASLSQHLLDGGRRTFCSLFTDLANPTSNKIYQQIGYRPVADFRRWELDDDQRV